jgi:hypothetical protein
VHVGTLAHLRFNCQPPGRAARRGGSADAARRFYEKNGFAEVDVSQLPAAFPVMKVDTKFYRLALSENASA